MALRRAQQLHGFIAALLALLLAMAVSPAGGAQPAAGTQVVRADDGLVAQGWVYDALFPDGSSRMLRAILVLPEKAVMLLPLAFGVDMAQPWITLSEWRNGEAVCSTVQNTTRWSRGARNERAAWTGVFANVTCDDGIYDFFRVSFDPGNSWMTTNPALTLPATQLWRWEAGETSGTIEFTPEATQPSAMTVCGHRRNSSGGEGGGFDCYGGGKHGWIAPETTAGLLMQASSAGDYASAPEDQKQILP